MQESKWTSSPGDDEYKAPEHTENTDSPNNFFAGDSDETVVGSTTHDEDDSATKANKKRDVLDVDVGHLAPKKRLKRARYVGVTSSDTAAIGDSNQNNNNNYNEVVVAEMPPQPQPVVRRIRKRRVCTFLNFLGTRRLEDIPVVAMPPRDQPTMQTTSATSSTQQAPPMIHPDQAVETTRGTLPRFPICPCKLHLVNAQGIIVVPIDRTQFSATNFEFCQPVAGPPPVKEPVSTATTEPKALAEEEGWEKDDKNLTGRLDMSNKDDKRV
jgi:hypothetical protein